MFGDDIQYIPRRPGEAKNTLADISKTSEATGWEPKVDIKGYVQAWMEAHKIV